MTMDIDPHADAFDAKTIAFTNWLKESQLVEIHPSVQICDLRSSGAGRGLVTNVPLAKDELIFSIPRSNVITIEASELNKLIGEELHSLGSPWLSLILVLIYETRTDSPWKPYIDILPRHFDTLMYWTPEELGQLRGSAVLEKIGRQEAEDQFISTMWPVVQKHPEIFKSTEAWGSRERFLEAAHRMGSIIMSYSFDLEPVEQTDKFGNSEDDDEDEEEEIMVKAMVPLADILNADADKNNCRLFQNPDRLEMRTICEVPVGSELFNDYGPLPRSDLLRRYGYVTPNYAPFDVVEISAPQIISVCNAEGKQDRLDYLLDEDVLDDAYDIEASMEIPEEILVVMHTLLMDDDKFSEYQAKGKVPRPKLTLEVGQVFCTLLELRLQQYETTIDQDEALLRDQSIDRRKRMAVEVRLGEKKILASLLEDVKRQLEGKRDIEEETGRSTKRVRRS